MLLSLLRHRQLERVFYRLSDPVHKLLADISLKAVAEVSNSIAPVAGATPLIAAVSPLRTTSRRSFFRCGIENDTSFSLNMDVSGPAKEVSPAPFSSFLFFKAGSAAPLVLSRSFEVDQ